VLELDKKRIERVATTISRSREQIRQYAIAQKYDYIFWIDSDTIPPIDVLDRFLHHNKEVVSGVYTYKGTDRVVATILVDKEKDLCSTVPYEKVIEQGLKDELLEIRACGFGCLLMHKSIFEQIPFETEFSQHESEDIRYCQRIGEKNITLWLDCKVVCLHLSDKLYEVAKNG
jgi:GT2 family glycosyltransferase